MTCGEGQTVQAAALEQQSPTFWHQGPVSWKTIFPWTGWGGLGGNASDGERWGEADEASLARPPLTSCRAPRFSAAELA